METKTCCNCHITKSIDEYHKDKTSRDGHTYACKECAKAKAQQWTKDNSERAKQSKHNRYYADPEKTRANHKKRWANATPEQRERQRQRLRANQERYAPTKMKYLEEHREESRKRAKDWYENNKRRAIDAVLKWRDRNIELVHSYKKNWRMKNKERINYLTMQRRIKERGVFSSMDIDQWIWLREQTNFLCLKCGKPDESMCRDHIIPIDPGTDTLDNMQPLCGVCNPKKGRKTIDYRPRWLKDAIRDKMKELGIEPQTDLLDRDD